MNDFIYTTSNKQRAFDGVVTGITGGSVRSGVTTALDGKDNSKVKSLTVSSGTISADDISYITTNLTGLTTLDLSGATLTVSQLIDILEGTTANVTVSSSTITGWDVASGEYITADMLSRLTGLTANDFITGLTNSSVNYVEDGAALVVTGTLTSSDLTTIKSKLDANPSLTTLDVSNCTNSSGVVEIADSHLSTAVTTVSLPGNDYIKYTGTHATALDNGSLTIAIGSGSGEYIDVATALSSLASLLASGDVEHVKITGTLTSTDLGNVQTLASNYNGVKTIDLSGASSDSWSSLSGDFANHTGVLVPSTATTGSITNAHVFTASGSTLTATNDGSDTNFTDAVSFFAQDKSASVVVTNASISLPLTGVTAVVSTSGTAMTVTGALTDDVLTAISNTTGATTIDFSGVTSVDASINWSNLTGPTSVEYILLPASQYAAVDALSSSSLTSLKAAGAINSSTGYAHVYQNTTGTASDGYTTLGALGLLGDKFPTTDQNSNTVRAFNQSTITKMVISGTLDTNDIKFGNTTNYATVMDLSGATISSFTGLAYGAACDVIAPANSSSTVMESYAVSTAKNIYSHCSDGVLRVLVYNEAALSDAGNYRDSETTLQVVQKAADKTATQSNGLYQAGVTALNSVTGFTTLDMTGILLSGNTNNVGTSFANTSIQHLLLSDMRFAYEGKYDIDISGCTALQDVDLSNAVMKRLIATSMNNLTTINLSDVTMTDLGSETPDANTAGVVNVTGTYTNTNFQISVDDEFDKNRIIPSEAQAKAEVLELPYKVSDCTVTINMSAASGKTLAEVIAAMEADTEKGYSGSICTLKVQGTLTTTDLTYLSNSKFDGVTKLDLSQATFTQDNLTLPANLVGLIITEGTKVTSATLKAAMGNHSTLQYVYSPSSDSQLPDPNEEDKFDNDQNLVADYVYVVKQGGLVQAFTNEEQLRNSYYIKVASDVALSSTDLNFNGLGDYVPSNYLFLDFSEAGLTPSNAVNYKVTDWIGYRVILPDDWDADDMAVFAALPYADRGNIAAVYSYDSNTGALNVLEITDDTYNEQALANPRIVRDGTTTLNIVTGTNNGTWGSFGSHLLAAINNAASTITTVNISTASCPNALTFTNDNITTLNVTGVSNSTAVLDVTACDALTTLNVTGSTLSKVDASGSSSSSHSSLTSVDLSGTTVSGATELDNTSVSTFTTSQYTSFGGTLDLTGSSLTAFTTAASITGNIVLTGSNSLTSVDVSAANFKNSSSTINVESSTGSGTYIAALKHDTDSDNEVDKSIHVPTGFNTSRIIPHGDDAVEYVSGGTGETNISNLIDVATAPTASVALSNSGMSLHEKDTNTETYDNYLYWYADETKTNDVATITTDAENALASMLSASEEAGKLNTSNVYTKVKIVGPLTSTDIESLSSLNTIVLDLSEAEITPAELATAFGTLNSDPLNSATKFLLLPEDCTRENLINSTGLQGLTNIYAAVATKTTASGTDVTSYSRVAGALQAALVTALPGAYSNTWTRNSKAVFCPGHEQLAECKISGLINAFDLSGLNIQLDRDGHLSWDNDASEVSKENETRALNGSESVYGPFSSTNAVYVMDLQNAEFELNSSTGKYYCSDMTLSALNIVGNTTRKVVIPISTNVKEIPADFMNINGLSIRSICIPSNIEIIRTRAFYTIDYVWTTKLSTDNPSIRTDNGAYYGAGVNGDAAGVAYGSSMTDFDYTAVPTQGSMGSYTFSSNLKMIETAAFANTQPHVKDVYVLAQTAPECHVDAFNTGMYVGSSGFAGGATDGIVTREAYINGDRYIAMLHYPRECGTPEIQRYTDPTRSYTIATGDVDGKGAQIYYPTYSEFLRAYLQGTYGYTWRSWDMTYAYGQLANNPSIATNDGWTSEGQTTANEAWVNNSGTDKSNTSFYDVTLAGGSQPSGLTSYNNVVWQSTNLYPLRNTANSAIGNEVTERDYRGWHQFVLTEYSAHTNDSIVTYRTYMTDNDWWTVCLPYDLRYSDLVFFYGVEAQTAEQTGSVAVAEQIPYLAELLNVVRDVKDKSITLNFSENLLTHNVTFSGDTWTQTVDASIKSENKVVLHKGVPYLIHPKIASGYEFDVYKDGSINTTQSAGRKAKVDAVLYRALKDAQDLTGSAQMALVEGGLYTVPALVANLGAEGAATETVSGTNLTYADKSYPVSSEYDYTFVGSFYNSFLPQNCYFLGWNNKATFYYSDLERKVVGQVGYTPIYNDLYNTMKWVNNTCVICPNMLSLEDGYSLGKGSHNGEVTEATGSGSTIKPAQWVIESLTNDYPASWDSGSSAKGIKMQFGIADNVTGINEVTRDVEKKSLDNDAWYTLGGQKLQSVPTQKGVYIVNGKKVVVK